MAEEADYIVVGAGSAGCVVASRLAESGARVILLEAGKQDSSRFVRVPGMISLMHSIPQIKKQFDWGYYTVPQKHALDRQIPHTRGKVLGGSSSINGMLFVRGDRSNYDGWAAEGCDGWSYDEVLPSFKRLESWEGGANEFRGADGPIAVTQQKDLSPASLALIEALSETLGVPENEDYNGASQEGVAPVQMSASGGLRFSSSRGYLASGGTVEVQVASTVTRIVFDRGRATGVEIAGKQGRRILRATREIVLSAGVFGSPQILMLSGIGPAGHLRDVGVDVRADLPVGQNLHDHLFVPMTFLAPEAKHRGTPWHFAGGMLGEATRGDTWFGRTVFDSMAFVRTDQAASCPDLQIHVLPWSYPAPNQDKPVVHRVDKRPALTVLPTMIYPKSRGEVRLASADPGAAPLIDPAYLAEDADARLLIKAMTMVREVMANARMTSLITGELHPGPDFPDENALARELPNRIHTVYHPVGTCRMGIDERAVVDPSLRVRGVEGLRVADASIMPTICGGNTNAPAMMIGERCAELMRNG